MQDASGGAPVAPARERNVLVLDLSKSMLAPLPEVGSAKGEHQKVEVARTAVFRILQDAANSGSLFGLVTFTETVRAPVPLGEIHKENLPYIENLISLLQPSGRSAIWDALAAGADLLRMGTRGVQGNLVLVTDGWDNASQRFDVRAPDQPTVQSGRVDLVPYLLPTGSNLTLRVIGIGSGDERDKGVDAGRVHRVLDQMTARAAELGLPGRVQLPGGHDRHPAVRPNGPRVHRRRVRGRPADRGTPSGGARAPRRERGPGPEGTSAARDGRATPHRVPGREQRLFGVP